MKVYSRHLGSAYPATPTTHQMNMLAAKAVSNLSRNSRVDYAVSLRGLGEGESTSTGLSAGEAIIGLASVALSIAVWGFAGYGVYKFANRK